MSVAIRQIPFVDLKAQYLSIKEEIDNAIQAVIDDTAFIGGETIKHFESAFASFIGTKHCIACANGTDSIEILLKAMGVGIGDEVLVPAISWISTSEAVSAVGAKPVFIDIDEHFTMDVSLIEEKIGKRTRAIIPVHLYGHPADMPSVMAIAEKHGLKVIEDCAQSHGATIHGKTTGTFGHAANFSFYPGKNLGAYGDAGAMLTNDDHLASTARQLANHGQVKKHEHVIEGRNSRMDTMQAAVLLAKLPHLEKWTNARILHAAQYNRYLENTNIKVPGVKNNVRHVYHLYVIQTSSREGLQAYLKNNGVDTAVHYPRALPFLPCYSYLDHKPGDFPHAFNCQGRILSLPMFPELGEADIEYVAELISDYLMKNGT